MNQRSTHPASLVTELSPGISPPRTQAARSLFSPQASSSIPAAIRFLCRDWPKVSLASLLLLVPCFWAQHVIFGDLGSHLYNAWLSLEIRGGRAPGLVLAWQWTNILFDIVVARLFASFGPVAAERIAVCASILVFFWGAMAAIRAISGRLAWWSVPLLYMLAYGWVLQNGLLNYYLSVGLSLFALGLLWETTAIDFLIAGILLTVACLAQPIPPVWAFAAAAYAWIFRCFHQHRGGIIIGSAAAIVAIRILVQVFFRTDWSARQVIMITGADQVYLFGLKYRIMYVTLAAIVFALLWHRYRQEGLSGIWAPDTTLYALVMFGIFVLPAGIWFPGHRMEYGFITPRLSILAAVVGLAAASYRDVPRTIAAAAVATALLFAIFLFRDTRRLNQWQEESNAIVAALPHGAKVWAYFEDARIGNRVGSTYSIVSRSCIGRCYVYSNYEPASQQFRVRVGPGGSPLAFFSYRQPFREYFNKHSGPLYLFDWCAPSVRQLCVTRLDAPPTSSHEP
jgi:hypothetical protein